MTRLLLISVFYFFSLQTSVFSQSYSSYSFNDLYGFEEDQIYSMKEDPRGYMWIGTGKGLVRFDGKNFTYFSNPNYDQSCSNIKIDEYNNVWFSNFSGQLFKLSKDFELQTFTDLGEEKRFVINYFPNGDDKVLILNNNATHIYELNQKTEKVTKVANLGENIILNGGIRNDTIYFLSVTNDENNIQKKKLMLQYFDSGKVQVLRQLSFPNQLSNKHSIFNSSRILFFQSTESTMVFDASNEMKPIFETENHGLFQVNSIAFLDKKLWLLTKNGIQIYSEKGELISSNALRSFSASQLLKDQEGNLWIGTLNKGIQIIPNYEMPLISTEAGDIKLSVINDNGDIYYSTFDGKLFLLRKGSHQPILIPLPFNVHTPFHINEYTAQILFSNQKDYLITKNHQIGKKDAYNKNLKDLTVIGPNYYVESYSIGCKVRSINKQSAQDFLDKYQIEENAELKSHGVIRNVRSLCAEKQVQNDNFYVSFIDGLYYYSTTNKPKEIKLNGQALFPKNLTQDSEKGAWLLDQNKHLLHINDGQIIDEINIPNKFKKVLPLKKQIILVGSNLIGIVDRKTKELRTIRRIDGLINEKISNGFILDNQLVVIGEQSIQYIPLNIEIENQNKPKLFLETVSNEGKHFELEDVIYFKHSQNNIQFDFRAYSIKSQKQHYNQYRLKESSEEWTTISGTVNEVQFLNLSPGEYTFQLRSCYEKGVCSDVIEQKFIIDKPVYLKWWFITLIIFTSLILISLLFLFRFRSIKAQNKLLREQETLRKDVYKSKISAIRSQLNPHFMFNSLNTIQQFIMDNQKEVASEYLADFSDLMRKYLDQSKREEICLSEEIETLEVYLSLENLRFNGELIYRISADPKIDTHRILIPTMLFQPFVENSIKHGLLHKEGAKKLDISFIQRDQELICTIEDNGIGREASHKINQSRKIKRNAFATTALDERIALVNKNSGQKISIETIDLIEKEQAIGTKVILKIQLIS